jgi:hypothetical protein
MVLFECVREVLAACNLKPRQARPAPPLLSHALHPKCNWLDAFRFHCCASAGLDARLSSAARLTGTAAAGAGRAARGLWRRASVHANIGEGGCQALMLPGS